MTTATLTTAPAGAELPSCTAAGSSPGTANTERYRVDTSLVTAHFTSHLFGADVFSRNACTLNGEMETAVYETARSSLRFFFWRGASQRALGGDFVTLRIRYAACLTGRIGMVVRIKVTKINWAFLWCRCVVSVVPSALELFMGP